MGSPGLWKQVSVAEHGELGLIECRSGLALIISDGFQSLSTFNNYMPEPNWEDVFLDSHNYQVFSDDQVAYDWPTHLSVRPGFGARTVQFINKTGNLRS
jgi:hypothetical protein